MGKNDFLSPKDIANRIKAKGLQKLRWYCQMCGKQCRDENGFKCHLTSEAHLRQMEVFGQDPTRIVDGFSEEFEKTFLEHLRRHHPRTRVEANRVYQEILQDRHHIHMNSTRWVTLSDFVQHLGEEGLCRIDETPRGWFILLVHPGDEEETKGRKRLERVESERAAEARRRKRLEEQARLAREAEAAGGQTGGPPSSSREGDDQGAAEGSRASAREALDRGAPVRISLAPGSEGVARSAPRGAAPAAAARAGGGLLGGAAGARGDDLEAGHAAEGGLEPSRTAGHPQGPPRKRSKLEELMEREQETRAKREAERAERERGERGGEGRARDGADGAGGGSPKAWATPGIVVKVRSKALKPLGYYGAKAEVLSVAGRVAELEILDGSGDVVRVDDRELDTVLPALGKRVSVVAGRFRGRRGVLRRLDERKYRALVELEAGGGGGAGDAGDGGLVAFEYEQVSKLAGG